MLRSQVKASRLWTTEAVTCAQEKVHCTPGVDSPILRTRDENQNALTAFATGLLVSLTENCKLVAVTEEKKVAMVNKLVGFSAARDCAERIVGTPEIAK